jgi:O-antigen ligase
LYKHFEEETSRGRLIRAGGTLNPTVLSEFIGIVAPLVLATSFIVARRLVSWALLGVFALGVAASVLTFSRAGVVSLALSTFIVLGGALLERAVPRSRKVIVAVGVGSVAVLLSVYFAASMLARVDAISTDTVGDESRLAQMRQAVAMIGEKPLLGTGLGLYRLHMGQHGPVLDFPVHNKYLNVTAEAGIPGGLLYLSLWLATLWIFVRRARRTAGAERMFFVGAVAAIVATLANMNTDVYGAGGAPEMALFVLTGLGLGYASRPPEYPAFRA